MPKVDVHGILNVNKPAVVTSSQVVALVKRWSGVPRVGHAGTLDPQATGVLLVCLGQATRMVEYLANASKLYQAEVELGITTDTYDSEGQITGRANAASITREQVESVLASFTGTIWQTPPMYSALKLRGKRLYQLARAGQHVELTPRQVNITRLELVEWQPPRFSLRVECGKGTYIRSLAYDIGRALGCGAYLAALVRLRVGSFDIEGSVSIPQLEEAFRQDCWLKLLYPPDKPLEGYKAVVVDDQTWWRIANGQLVPLAVSEAIAGPTLCRAYTLDGRFIAVLRFEPTVSLWHPYKVFREPPEYMPK